MGWWRKFRDFDRRGLLIERVEGSFAFTHRGYVFDRRIFRGFVLLMVLLLVYVGLSSGVSWREVYVHCPYRGEVVGLSHVRDGYCENPFYLDCAYDACRSIEYLEYLPPGFTLGRPPSEEFAQGLRGLFFAGVGGFVVAFALNHFVHNKGKPLEYILRGDEL